MIAGVDQGGDGEAAAGGFSREDDVGRGCAASQEGLVGRESVVDRCRVGVFGGEPVVDGDDLGACPPADLRGQAAAWTASPSTYTPPWKYRTTWRGPVRSAVISAVGTPPSSAAVTVTSAGSGCAEVSSRSSRRCSLTSMSAGKADCRRMASRFSRCSVLTEDVPSVGGWLGSAPGGAVMSDLRRNPGREAGHCQAGRQAGEQASPHHGDPRGRTWAPKVVAGLTPGPAALTRSNGSPSERVGALGHRSPEQHPLLTATGCTRSPPPESKHLSPDSGDLQSRFPDATANSRSSRARWTAEERSLTWLITQQRRQALYLGHVMGLVPGAYSHGRRLAGESASPGSGGPRASAAG